MFDKLVEGLVAEVFEDGLLASLPGRVQCAGGVFSAGTIVHDAAGNAEGALGRLDGVAEGDLRGGAREAGAATAALATLDQPGAGEVGQDASEQPARDAGLGRDAFSRRLLPQLGEVDQSPQSVPSLATQLQLQTKTP
jgi:hypothetical protein